MLTIAKLNAHSVVYYESTVEEAREQVGADTTDYYSEHGQTLPRAFVMDGPAGEKGATESALGVEHGQVMAADEVESWLVGGVTPDRTARLGQAFNQRSVLGFDLTFSSPKSVSIVGEIMGDDGAREVIAEAHRAGVEAGLKYLADHATYTQQRPAPGEAPEIFRVQALSGVSYEHHTARPVVDDDGVEHVDPHTHTHVLLSNRQLDENGRFVSLDGTSIYHEARAAGMVAAAAERQVIRERLGLEFEAVDPATGLADLVGFDRETIDQYSHRRSQIKAWSDAQGHEFTAASSGVAQKRTREVKNTDLSPEEQREMWREQAAADGVPTLDQLYRVSAQRRRELGELATAERPPSAEAILLHATQDKSTFTRADLVESAASLMPAAIPEGVDPRRAIETAADRALDHAIRLEGPTFQALERETHGGVQAQGQREGAVRFSTPDVIAHEINATWTATDTDRHAASSARHLAAPDETFSVAQHEAMTHLVESETRVSTLIAAAGAGKTSSLARAAEVWREDFDRADSHDTEGRHIIGLAPTGQASDIIAAEGLTDHAMTIDRALAQLDRGESPFGWRDVVIVDEAAMASDQQLTALIDAAESAGSKLILCGDDKQLATVNGRSGLFSWLAENGDSVELGEVFRQRDEAERAATLGLRGGSQEALDASLDWYEREGRVVSGSTDAMLSDAWEAWHADVEAGKDSLLLAPTWEAAGALNARTQLARIEAGEIDPERSRSAALSANETAYEGDVILTRRNEYGLVDSKGMPVRNGNRWVVDLVHDNHDMVRLARQDDPTTKVEVPHAYLRDHARLGWASTIHASQGRTVDTVHGVMAEDSTNREQAYVALTRGRDENRAYVITDEGPESSHGHEAAPDPDQPLENRRDDPETARQALGTIAVRDAKNETAIGYATRLEGDARHGHTISEGDAREYFGDKVTGRLMELREQQEQRRQQREAEHVPEPEPAEVAPAREHDDVPDPAARKRADHAAAFAAIKAAQIAARLNHDHSHGHDIDL